MSAFFRLRDTLRKSVSRNAVKAIIGATAVGLIAGTVLAFGLATAASGLPFALSTSQLPSPTPTARAQLGNRVVPENPTASTGCGATSPAADGQTVAGSVTVNGRNRDYWLHIPRAYVADQPTSMVLAFHGHGGTATSFEHFSRLSSLADQHGFLVVYPQGAVGPDGKTGWDTFRRNDPTIDDVGFVDALLTHLQATLCVDPARIYATGFSNGGGFVDVLACDLASRIAAFAPVSGDYYPHPGGCHPSRAVSLLEIHGTADTTNPYNGSTQLGYPSVGQWLTDWASRDRCAEKPTLQGDGTGVVTETWGACLDGTTLAHYRLIGIGHTWLLSPNPTAGASSGASQAEQLLTFDTDAVVWDFFATQMLPAASQA